MKPSRAQQLLMYNSTHHHHRMDTIISPISQMKELRHREAKALLKAAQRGSCRRPAGVTRKAFFSTFPPDPRLPSVAMPRSGASAKPPPWKAVLCTYYHRKRFHKTLRWHFPMRVPRCPPSPRGVGRGEARAGAGSESWRLCEAAAAGVGVSLCYLINERLQRIKQNHDLPTP